MRDDDGAVYAEETCPTVLPVVHLSGNSDVTEQGASLQAVGAGKEVADLPENLQQRETAPRSRRPLAEFVFEERWGAPSRLA